MLLKSHQGLASLGEAAGINLDMLNAQGLAGNLVPVTLGNIVGGTLLVAGVYWFAYLRAEKRSTQQA
jgi:formate/nitrite transporter FocA (FNT family)